MSYTAEISRTNPSCFLFLIDQSGSMQEVMNPTEVTPLDNPISVDGQTYTQSASGPTKAQTVADTINRILQNLIIKCARNEGIRDYYHVGVIGYGGDSTATRVGSAFGGALQGRDLVPVSEIGNAPARIDERNKKVPDGAGGLVEQKVKFPIWFDAVANGGTPMCGALEKAKEILTKWNSQHPTSSPPIVINITDGEATDGDPAMVAESLRALASNDGNVLLFNIHITSQQGKAIEFPDSDSALTDRFAKLLFGISSVLPSHMQNFARQEGMAVTELSRGFAFKADMISLIKFLDIGTRPSNMR